MVVDGNYEATFNVLEDAEVAVVLPQGTGRDHTDWSWHFEQMEAFEEMEDAKADVNAAQAGLAGAMKEYEDALRDTLSPAMEHQRNCQLHREEEINLYYQCTQNDINNYSLHHFGGERRSYPRWVDEYNVCIDHIHTAKTLHLDYYHDDGTVTLEPCDPQTHTSTVYIEQEAKPTFPKPEVAFNPAKPCDNQNMPDISGLWIEVYQGPEHATKILSGEAPVTDTHTMRCYSVDKDSKMMHETWDEVLPREYTMELKPDTRYSAEGCMLYTTLLGTSYSQWVSSIGGGILPMTKILEEEWHESHAAGETSMDKKVEIKIGTCTHSADKTVIGEKHFDTQINFVL